MRKIIVPFIAVVFLSVLQQCKKEAKQEPAASSNITVLEKGTRKPVAGATVDLLRCVAVDLIGGCIYDPTPLQTLTADAQGRATLPPGVKPAGVSIRHPDFWDLLKEGNFTEVMLSPNAWVSIRMKRTGGNYNPGSSTYVSVARDCNDCGGVNVFLNYYENIGLPADTTFTVRVEATEKTTVSCFVKDLVNAANDKSGASQPFTLTKSETLKLTFDY